MRPIGDKEKKNVFQLSNIAGKYGQPRGIAPTLKNTKELNLL
jgi:hypothetical protein